jgi:hypothetical protein
MIHAGELLICRCRTGSIAERISVSLKIEFLEKL